MKKVLSLLLIAVSATTLCAQRTFVASPVEAGGGQFSMQGVAMTDDHHYVVGTDAITRVPTIWNTQTNDVVFINVIETIEGDTVLKTGSFHAVNGNGIAVGSLTSQVDYISVPVMASVDGNGSYTQLFSTSDDAGSDAYGITADGSTIVGFHFDASWTTHACIWTNNGQTRTDLPLPTAEQLGFEFDYVGARWISADGSTILGYAQDANTGNWVAMAWRRNGTTYEPVSFSNDYFQTYTFDESGNPVLPEQPNPYYIFEPTALSQDGNYVALRLVEAYDLNDFSLITYTKAGRYNLSTNTFEVLENGINADDIQMFGIANDGTCVGRMDINDEATWETYSDGVIWKAGSGNDFTKLVQEYQGDAYLSDITASALSTISPDASSIMGYVINADGTQTSFVVPFASAPLAIDEVDTTVAPRVKGIYDMMGRRLQSITRSGIYFIDGKKVFVTK